MAVFLRPMFSFHKPLRYLLFSAALSLILTIIFALYSLPVQAQAGHGDTIFEAKCRACHSIGGGRGVGPDLVGISQRRERTWILDFIMTPDKLIQGGDPIAQELVKQYGLPMPNLNISQADAEAILDYIDSYSSAPAPSTPPPTTAPPPTTTPPTDPSIVYDANAGRDLFSGRLIFQNGGASCISCHNLNALGVTGGGSLAKDLSASYNTMGEVAMASILKTTPFPIMTDIYSAKPLSEQEITALLAFMKEASQAPAPTQQSPAAYFIISIIGAAVIIGIFPLVWRGRLSGVRQTLVKGGSK